MSLTIEDFKSGAQFSHPRKGNCQVYHVVREYIYFFPLIRPHDTGGFHVTSETAKKCEKVTPKRKITLYRYTYEYIDDEEGKSVVHSSWVADKWEDLHEDDFSYDELDSMKLLHTETKTIEVDA